MLVFGAVCRELSHFADLRLCVAKSWLFVALQ